MKHFEYKSIPFLQLKTEHYMELDVEKLNEVGKEGWEFVTIQSGQCIFKKEKKVRTVRNL